MTEDELARQMIRDHIETCKEDRKSMKSMFDQIWEALDDIRKDRRSMQIWIIRGLIAACASLIAYIWVEKVAGL